MVQDPSLRACVWPIRMPAAEPSRVAYNLTWENGVDVPKNVGWLLFVMPSLWNLPVSSAGLRLPVTTIGTTLTLAVLGITSTLPPSSWIVVVIVKWPGDPLIVL